MARTTEDEMVTITKSEYDRLVSIAEGSSRYAKVEPAQFAALKAEFGLSSKDMAEAIGRTLSRVSELTKSKGASQAVFDRVKAQVIEWRESHPVEA